MRTSVVQCLQFDYGVGQRGENSDKEIIITLTGDIVAAHVSNNNVAVGDFANLVQLVHGALSGIAAGPVEEGPQAKEPVVRFRASIKPEYLVRMECAKKQKTLRATFRPLITHRFSAPNVPLHAHVTSAGRREPGIRLRREAKPSRTSPLAGKTTASGPT